jgi:Winged helix DNA-binding domain
VPGDVLTLRQINRATLARQMLLRRERTTPLRAIEALVALQGQWPRPPFLGLFTRVEGFERADLARLLERRQVVRATFLRATLHVLSAKDFVALRSTIQPVLDAAMTAIARAKGARFAPEKVAAHARTFLAGEPRTFEEIREHLLRASPGADERAMGYAVRMFLPLVQVPVGGDAPWAFTAVSRFALAEDWLKQDLPRDAPPRIEDLVRRYLAAYGPASVKDVEAWSGLPRLRATIEAMRSRLRTFRDEAGRELLDLPNAPRPDPDTPAPVRLVPEYDNLITTRADERFVARAHRPRVFLSALRIAATVLVDGFAVGTWKVERSKRKATVAIAPFGALSPANRRAVAEEAEAVARFAEPDASAVEVRIAK